MFTFVPSQLVIEKDVGDGSQGTVSIGTYCGHLCAAKFYHCADSISNSKAYILEKNMLIKFKRIPGVVRLFAADDSKCLLVMQRAACDLDGWIHNNRGNYPISTAFSLMNQLVGTVNSMHKHRIAHRDIKPANILVMDKNGTNVTLSDFGLACPMHIKVSVSGTPGYMPPILDFSKTTVYTEYEDFYALGRVFIDILRGAVSSVHTSGALTRVHEFLDNPKEFVRGNDMVTTFGLHNVLRKINAGDNGNVFKHPPPNNLYGENIVAGVAPPPLNLPAQKMPNVHMWTGLPASTVMAIQDVNNIAITVIDHLHDRNSNNVVALDLCAKIMTACRDIRMGASRDTWGLVTDITTFLRLKTCPEHVKNNRWIVQNSLRTYLVDALAKLISTSTP